MKFFLTGMGLLLGWGLLIIGGLHIWIGLSPTVILAVLVGIILAWLFVSSGFVGFYRSLYKPARTFGKIFLFSFFSRLAALTVILVLLIKFTAINLLPLFLSLLTGFFVFQIWEVISFNRLEIGKS